MSQLMAEDSVKPAMRSLLGRRNGRTGVEPHLGSLPASPIAAPWRVRIAVGSCIRTDHALPDSAWRA